jgi:hypothetical protein
MMQFFNMKIGLYTQPKEFSLGLMSMEMHLNIFPGQHNRQTKCHRNTVVSFREYGGMQGRAVV